MTKKLDTLELIEDRIKTVEHAEVNELKENNKARKVKDEETKQRLEKLEKENAALNNSAIDLKARSMRDNLIFYKIEENERENATEIIHKCLKEKMGIEDAATKIKTDRSHRLG